MKAKGREGGSGVGGSSQQKRNGVDEGKMGAYVEIPLLWKVIPLKWRRLPYKYKVPIPPSLLLSLSFKVPSVSTRCHTSYPSLLSVKALRIPLPLRILTLTAIQGVRESCYSSISTRSVTLRRYGDIVIIIEP
jgi:hypothetical protein